MFLRRNCIKSYSETKTYMHTQKKKKEIEIKKIRSELNESFMEKYRSTTLFALSDFCSLPHDFDNQQGTTI